MKNNIFIRIDDRLLHGQVVVSWIPYLKTNEVVIADDEYAKDEFMCELIKASGAEGLNVYVKSIDEAGIFLDENKEKNILVLLRSVEAVKRLAEKVNLTNINIGGLGATKARKRIHNSIHLSDEEINILKDLASKNINVEIKMLPKDRALDIDGI